MFCTLQLVEFWYGHLGIWCTLFDMFWKHLCVGDRPSTRSVNTVCKRWTLRSAKKAADRCFRKHTFYAYGWQGRIIWRCSWASLWCACVCVCVWVCVCVSVCVHATGEKKYTAAMYKSKRAVGAGTLRTAKMTTNWDTWANLCACIIFWLCIVGIVAGSCAHGIRARCA